MNSWRANRIGRGGQLLAFFGPDGVGKSTTADLVEHALQTKGLETRRYHWRPRVLPSSVRPGKITVDVSCPDDLRPRHWLTSLFLYVYFFLDFLWAYLVRFRPLLRRGVFIIYERYYYDLLFHPRRYRLQEISFLAELLSRLLPCPDLMILLSGEPSTIFARKPELPLDEIKRQQHEMKRYLPRYAATLCIDVTDAEPSEIVHRILQALIQQSASIIPENHCER